MEIDVLLESELFLTFKASVWKFENYQSGPINVNLEKVFNANAERKNSSSECWKKTLGENSLILLNESLFLL